MSDALFTVAEVWEGDPLRPDRETPTPDEIVAGLTACQRTQRVEWLVEQAHGIYHDGIAEHSNDRDVAASVVLFSGGNDSTTLAHLFRDTATHAAHANTGIGIEDTRQFVRDTCAAWGLPLIEKHAPDSYRDLVIERGFPGPAMHFKMYARLKERALDLVRHDLGVANSRTRCAVFIAGRRRAESKRREDVPLYEPDGSVIWVSPIALWTKLDLNTYRAMFNVPVNPVSAVLHMSGECLCGAYAHPGELDEIADWFPSVAAEIHDLEREVRAAGIEEPFCIWGHGQGAPSGSGRLCGTCDSRFAQQLDFGGVA